MKSAETWKPTKFECHGGKLRAPRSTEYVSRCDRFLVDEIGRVYSEWIPQYCRGRLVDLGCGEVPFYSFYQPYVSEVVTVDWENTSHPNSHIDIYADLNAPPISAIDDHSADCILCSDVLEHIYQPKILVKEMSRMLKPDGWLLLNVPFLFYVHEEPYDFYRYTPFSLRRMLEENGFEVREIQPLGGPREVFAQWNTLIFDWYGRQSTRKWFVKGVSWLYWLLGKGLLKASRVKEGSFYVNLGYAVIARKK